MSDADGEDAANKAEREALHKKFTDDARAACPERSTDGKLLLARFRAHQKQICHVGAGDEHHQADGGHDDPEQLAHIADDLLLQRAKRGRDAPLLIPVRIGPRTVGPGIHPDLDEARDIAISLCDGHAWPKAANALKGEAGERLVVRIEAHGGEYVEVLIDDAEARWHHADDGALPRIDHDAAANHGAVSAKAALPIAITQHDVICIFWILIDSRERAAKKRRNIERLRSE